MQLYYLVKIYIIFIYIILILGVYELRMYDLILGKKEQWEHRFIQGFFERCKLSEPVGVWFTEFGPINRGTVGIHHS